MKFIDISVPITSGMFRFPRPDHVTVSIAEKGTYEEVACRTSSILMGSHSGTHIDAPMHMIRDGQTVDQIPLENLVGTARILRIKSERGGIIDRDSVDPHLIDEPRVILDSGWHTRWATDEYYKDFPLVTDAFANLLIERGVKCLVVDLPLTIEIHNIILGSGACQVENVIGLDKIKGDKVKLIALPLKIKGIEAAPARVIVIEEM